MKTGIYKIVCLPTGKVYVGQSKKLKSRKYQHLKSLKSNRHYNKYLQNAFNKYGVDQFKFEYIEQCEPENLNIREAYWINKLKANQSRYGFNLAAVNNNQTLPSEQYTITQREAAIKAHKKNGKNWVLVNLLTGEVEPIDAKKDYPVKIKANQTQNFKEGIVILNEDFTLEQYKNVHKRYNLHISNVPKHIYALNTQTKECKEFGSITSASKTLNIKDSTIGNLLKGKGIQSKGWKFSYTQEFAEEVKLPDITVYVLDVNGYRKYDSIMEAGDKEYPGNKRGRYYIKQYLDSRLSYLGKMFYTSIPTDDQILQAKLGLTNKEFEMYKHVVNGTKFPSKNKGYKARLKNKVKGIQDMAGVKEL